MKEETVVWEHPIYGIVVVTYRWRMVDPVGLFEWTPISVQWPLFVPEDEQAEMMLELLRDEKTWATVLAKMASATGCKQVKAFLAHV